MAENMQVSIIGGLAMLPWYILLPTTAQLIILEVAVAGRRRFSVYLVL